MKKIDILLSTYNGEKYIREQLDSLFLQTCDDWCLIVRDDGSKDKTVQIIKEYIEKYGEDKIVLLSDSLGNIGAKLSFGQLIKFSQAPYIMLCDQDDVWLENKVELFLQRMTELEAQRGAETPVLIFSDFLLVNEKLEPIFGKGFGRIGKNPGNKVRFRNLILRNIICGNTVMINRNLGLLSVPVPEEAFMHDWWVAILASAFGCIDYIDSPTILYRQHNLNVCGRGFAWIFLQRDFKEKYKIYAQEQDRIFIQAEYVLKSFEEDLLKSKNVSKKDFEDLSLVAHLDERSFIGKVVSFFRMYSFLTNPFYAVANFLLYFKLGLAKD